MLVKFPAVMLKKFAFASKARAFPIIVLPFPGGPNKRTALGGDLTPTKRSGRLIGQTNISSKVILNSSKPIVSDQLVVDVAIKFNPSEFKLLSLLMIVSKELEDGSDDSEGLLSVSKVDRV